MSLGSLCTWHLVAQFYPTLWDSTDCSPPNSSVHGISQARILDWAAISFSRASSRPRDRTRVSCIAGGLFTSKSPREALVKVDLLLTAAHSGCCRLPRAEEGHVTLNPHRQSLEEQLYSPLPRWNDTKTGPWTTPGPSCSPSEPECHSRSEYRPRSIAKAMPWKSHLSLPGFSLPGNKGKIPFLRGKTNLWLSSDLSDLPGALLVCSPTPSHANN